MRRIMSKVGLREQNMPTMPETILLAQHIIENYGNHTLAEIELAFDMAITDKLDCEFKHYENFSCAYFSGVMNAYRKWAREEAKQIKPIAMIEQSSDMTDQEMDEWVEEWRGKVERESLDLIPLCFYKYLNIQVEKKAKFEYLKKAADYRKAALYNLTVNGTNDDVKNYGAFIKMYATGQFEGVESDRIKNVAKRMIIKDYLTKKL